jgi:hypothetical protein
MEETSSLEALAPSNRNSDFDRLQLVIFGDSDEYKPELTSFIV